MNDQGVFCKASQETTQLPPETIAYLNKLNMYLCTRGFFLDVRGQSYNEEYKYYTTGRVCKTSVEAS